jgi:class 3 adenylate cyclase
MAEAHVERRLAAVLAADVAGYSRLMGIDEEGTLEALKAHRRELIDPKIAEHRGRIVKTTGDGALVEFASAVDATRCATEIQNTMVERNASIPEGRRVEFRIGINVGDVIIDEGDIFGDGVNLAARLESIAQPGGICLSDDDYRQVRDKLDLNFQNFGEQELKNITRPVRVYRLRPPTTPPGGPDTSNQSSCASRQAVHRRAAVPEHERRSRAGIFRRRHGRRHHYRAFPHQLALRYRAQFEFHIQGPGDRCETNRPRTWRALCARRERAQGDGSHTKHRAAQ